MERLFLTLAAVLLCAPAFAAGKLAEPDPFPAAFVPDPPAR